MLLVHQQPRYTLNTALCRDRSCTRKKNELTIDSEQLRMRALIITVMESTTQLFLSTYLKKELYQQLEIWGQITISKLYKLRKYLSNINHLLQINNIITYLKFISFIYGRSFFLRRILKFLYEVYVTVYIVESLFHYPLIVDKYCCHDCIFYSIRYYINFYYFVKLVADI